LQRHDQFTLLGARLNGHGMLAVMPLVISAKKPVVKIHADK